MLEIVITEIHRGVVETPAGEKIVDITKQRIQPTWTRSRMDSAKSGRDKARNCRCVFGINERKHSRAGGEIECLPQALGGVNQGVAIKNLRNFPASPKLVYIK